MKSLRTMLLLGSMVFAMGAVAGCGDDDDDGTKFDAPVTTQYDAPSSTVDGGTRDAATADSRIQDAAQSDG